MKKALFPKRKRAFNCGAVNQIRTGDLVLTKDALYLLSYISVATKCILAWFERICNPFCPFSQKRFLKDARVSAKQG